MFLLPLLACTGSNDDDDDKSRDSGEDDSAAPVDTGEPQRPEVQNVESVSCTPVADGADAWVITANVTDPQGNDTLSKLDSYIVITVDDEPVGGQHAMTCKEGQCSGSWRAEAGEPCSLAGTAEIVIVAVDEDGHESEPFEEAY